MSREDRQTNERFRPGALFAFFLAVGAAGISLVAMTENERWGFAATGLLITGISILPFLDRSQRIISLWGLVTFVMIIGMGVRGVMISAGLPDERTVDAVFFIGSNFDSFYIAAVMSISVMLAATIGYIASSRLPNRRSYPSREPGKIRIANITDGNLFCIVVGYQIIGLIATRSYSRGVGGLAAPIADRRTVLGGSGSFESHGIAEYLASFGSVASIFLLAVWLSRHKALGALRISLLLTSFALGFSINLVTTTRTDLVYVSASALAVYVVIRKKVPLKIVIGLGLAVLIGVGALTSERRGDTEAQLGVGYSIQSALLNRNAADVSKTLKVIAAVPEQLPYQYGKTIGGYAYAWIPRTVWPDKPVVSPGPIIGRTIYGLPRTGVPPGAIAELVWNFGALAVIFGGLLGGLLGEAERRFYPNVPQDLGRVIFYALVVLPLGKDVFGVAIGQAVSAALQAALPLFGIWVIAAVRDAGSAPRRQRREGTLVGAQSQEVAAHTL